MDQFDANMRWQRRIGRPPQAASNDEVATIRCATLLHLRLPPEINHPARKSTKAELLVKRLPLKTIATMCIRLERVVGQSKAGIRRRIDPGQHTKALKGWALGGERRLKDNMGRQKHRYGNQVVAQ
jgi:hypothetical protein